MGPSEESDIVDRLSKQLSDDNINTNDDEDEIELQTQSQQQQAQQQQPLPHHDHIQLLMDALEKLDPDKNGLVLVPKEITSSTLTTRLKGVCKINRLIDYSNDLCHSFTEIGAQAKYQEAIARLRDWILENKIIEHIFGPNCHVEIIKQSHTILNFVAYTLNDEHVNVIWSASLLKHCGRQVLDLLTSLIRFMRTGPVLHLYWQPQQQQSPTINDLDIRPHPRQHHNHHSHNQQRLSNSPLSEYSATKCDTDGPESVGDVKQSVVDHILKSISTSSATSSSSDFSSQDQRHQHHSSTEIVTDPSSTIASDQRQQVHCAQPIQCDLETDNGGHRWLKQLKGDAEFLDNTSDVSACCSEEKNMDDFDDEAQEFIQDENTIGDTDEPNSSPNRIFNPVDQHHVRHHGSHNSENPKLRTLNSSSSRSLSSDLENRGEILGLNDSTSTSRDSETKFRLSLEQNQNPQLNEFQLPLESVAQFKEFKKASGNLSKVTAQLSGDEDLKRLSEYNLGNLSEPGKTLLWDLLQDGKIELLTSNLHVEIENVLVNLVMSFGDRYIRYKFIEACLENLSVGSSVILSLRLLPKLMSFSTISRNLSIPAINETHTIVLWAESEYNMSQNFFKNLVDYYQQRQQLFSKLIPLAAAEGTTATCATASAIINEQIRHLEEYGDLNCKSPLFSHLDKIMTRMSFLTDIYSKPFSPETMKLNRDQMDQLWDCLASDSNVMCSDVLFQWIYQQAVGDGYHGVNDELLDYVLKHKLPTLRPEHFRLRGLKLLEQLLWIRQDYECCHGLEHPATRLLWDIALKAVADEVSMTAIRILNHFYIYTNHRKSTKCDKGINFMNYCMDQLYSSLKNLTNLDERKREQRDDPKDVNQLMDLMQKVILLIRTHLEVFRAHWSFYLRICQLNNEADLISHRLNAYDIKSTMAVRLVCQAASSADKTTIEVHAGDFVGELRAEIVKWWFSQVDRTYFEQPNSLSPSRSLTNSTSSSPSSNITPANQHPEDTLANALTSDRDLKQISSSSSSSSSSGGGSNSGKTPMGNSNSLNGFTEFLLANHHSLRLLSHSQEIPFEWDERQINQLDFKEMQVIYVLNDVKSNTNADTNDDIDSDKSNESPQQNYPLKTEIPSILLLRHEYFERLMEADRFLGSFKSTNIDLTNRAKTLSRRVWEIIQILPTCPNYEADLKQSGSPNYPWGLQGAQCSCYLSADCPQMFLYCLQIIDILKSSIDNPNWANLFIRKGGLEDIFDVFMSQKLLPDENEDWNEWLQECLAYLLKLIFQFGIKPTNSPVSSSSSIVVDSPASSSSSKMSVQSSGSSRTIMTDNSSNSVKRTRRNRNRLLGSNTSPVSTAVVLGANTIEDRLPIPQFSEELLKLLANTDLIFDKLIRILTSSAFSSCHSDQYYYVAMSSRATIVSHVMSFLASWCKSDPKFPKFQISNYSQLLKALILDDTDPSTRREACNGFFKLHHACSMKQSSSAINSSISSINSTLNTSQDSPNTSGIFASCNSSTTSIQCETSASNLQTQPTTNTSWSLPADLLKCLIEFLPITEKMKPPKPIRNYVSENDYIKELNSPGCKDYFWLTCRLIDSQATQIDGSSATKTNAAVVAIGNKEQKEELISMDESLKAVDGDKVIADESDKLDDSVRSDASIIPKCATTSNAINLFELCEYLVVAIRKRRTYETRDFSVEDDTLRGMLLMMVMALRRDPSFRYTITAFEFIHELYEYLFAPPNQAQRYLPKCKSPTTRSTAFELMISLVERCPKNYFGLLELLLVDQHNSVVKGTYPTDYWPHDDCRSEVGFVGLINLGATCYLATCMQHLFMIPNLRYAILSIEDTKTIRHGEIIRELQKIFAFMLESERKAYNPRNFCKVYTMDNHPLNIAEQTDMTEFLTDLITKLEESSPELRQIIKGLFSGTLSNNVVSLDCPHISRTTEEFYTLRVQVADMRNLNESLDELTVKDTLEGDNMYTCSTCEKKVRAEKRACIVKLPRILCFNTMRYTFNMATMTKEKVNTHFSFPLKLDMADYLEANLMKRQQSSLSNAGSYTSKDSALRSSSSFSASTTSSSHSNSSSPSADSYCLKSSGPTKESSSQDDCEHPIKTDQDGEHLHSQAQSPRPGMARSPSSCSSESASAASTSPAQEIEVNDGRPEGESETVYELIGVTVHTGNADGGHYYCFIRDCEDHSKDKPRWYLFNDAEVKLFDDSLIGTECYGGELTTKSYDAINDRFMDFSIEKTNSAYMLFYKRVDYKYKSRSVALRYLESDTERSNMMPPPPNVRRQSESERPESEVNEDGMELSAAPTSDNESAARTGCSLINQSTSSANESGKLDFNRLCQETYDDFELPKNLANWIWSDNMKFARDKNVFEHNYFSFMWQICANLPRTLNHIPEHLVEQHHVMGRNSAINQASDDAIAIRTVHLAIAFVLGVLMNSRERPNLSNWTELIRKQFNSSKAACDWLMHLIDDEETWLKQMLLKCPIEMVRQLFQRLCNDLTGSRQHKKLRLIR